MTLRSGTVMHGSNLFIRDWFASMSLLMATKRAISAKKIQRQLSRKGYKHVWEMVHKLRDVMGKRDDSNPLHSDMEIDEGFFSIAPGRVERLPAETRTWQPAQDFRMVGSHIAILFDGRVTVVSIGGHMDTFIRILFYLVSQCRGFEVTDDQHLYVADSLVRTVLLIRQSFLQTALGHDKHGGHGRQGKSWQGVAMGAYCNQ